MLFYNEDNDSIFELVVIDENDFTILLVSGNNYQMETLDGFMQNYEFICWI